MSSKLRVRKAGKTPILEIIGQVTTENITKITGKLDSLRKDNTTIIAIDLSQTTFIDSHGLGALIYYWRMLDKQNRQLVIINPQSFINEMLTGTNLDQVFRIVDSEEAL